MSNLIPEEAVEAGSSTRAFLAADYVIPSHGGSMASGFVGTAKDAQRIIDKFTSPHEQEAP